MMEIDAESGQVVNKWSRDQRLASSDDKMSSALKKLEDDKKKRATFFDKAKGDLEGQKKKLEESFKKQMEKAKKEGVPEKPFRPFDLD